jgi:hypothetical protein
VYVEDKDGKRGSPESGGQGGVYKRQENGCPVKEIELELRENGLRKRDACPDDASE